MTSIRTYCLSNLRIDSIPNPRIVNTEVRILPGLLTLCQTRNKL
uniref:Uncharacterized protein n=1 Tax=Arundo donax TaxID=35708 RepID=A0A0A8Z889_ARUDO